MARLNHSFQDFISNHNPKEVNRHLRDMFMEYVNSLHESGLPLDLRHIIWEMNDLFALLDDAEDMQARKLMK